MNSGGITDTVSGRDGRANERVQLFDEKVVFAWKEIEIIMAGMLRGVGGSHQSVIQA